MTSKKPKGRGGTTSLAKKAAVKRPAAKPARKAAAKKNVGKSTADKKKRVPLPPDVVAEVLFASDHTCCKCWIAGKDVQVHHIDDDPANNSSENLAVLCFDCHNETQVRGGFGRRFSAPEVTRYRDDWLVRVRNRRDQADALVVATLAGVRQDQGTLDANNASHSDSASRRSHSPGQPELPGRDGLAKYVEVLPTLRLRAYLLVQARNPRTTLDTVESYFDLVAVLSEILVALISYYPRNHFSVNDAEHYVSGVVSERTHWHYLRSSTDGVGRSGSLVQIQTVMGVVRDLERMVADMVSSLTGVALRDPDEHELEWHRSWSSPVLTHPGLEAEGKQGPANQK